MAWPGWRKGDLGKGITVNAAVAPGFVKTAMTGQIPKDITDRIIESIPVGRFAEPWEVARAGLGCCHVHGASHLSVED